MLRPSILCPFLPFFDSFRSNFIRKTCAKTTSPLPTIPPPFPPRPSPSPHSEEARNVNEFLCIWKARIELVLVPIAFHPKSNKKLDSVANGKVQLKLCKKQSAARRVQVVSNTVSEQISSNQSATVQEYRHFFRGTQWRFSSFTEDNASLNSNCLASFMTAKDKEYCFGLYLKFCLESAILQLPLPTLPKAQTAISKTNDLTMFASPVGDLYATSQVYERYTKSLRLLLILHQKNTRKSAKTNPVH